MKPENKRLLAALFAAVITAALFIPSLGNGFVSWDDHAYVYQNLDIKLTGIEVFKKFFLTAVNSNWHPLTMLSYVADFRLWGMDPFGFHLQNLLFHAADTFLVALLFFRIAAYLKMDGKASLYSGFIAALLFGAHPLRVESVVWISERKDVLSAFFFLLSMYCYHGYAADGKRGGYIASLALFVPALLSKSMAMTLPLALLILDYFPYGRLNGLRALPRLIIEKLPFFALSVATGVIAMITQKQAITSDYTIPERVITAVRSYGFYLYKTALPLNLSPYYPRQSVFSWDYGHALGLALVIGITAFCALTHKRQRAFSAVWAYYIVTLAPVIGMVQLASAAAADRYTYIPCIGLCFLAGAFSGRLIAAAGPARRASYIAVLAAVFVFLAKLTIAQSFIWKDTVTLWRYAISTGYASPTVHLFMGDTWEENGKTAEAIEEYTKCIEIDRKYLDCYIYRGNAYGTLSQYDKAIDDFNSVIKVTPKLPGAYNFRGVTRFKMGQYEKSIEDLNAAIRLQPEYGAAYHNLAFVYWSVGEKIKSEEAEKKALALGYDASRVAEERGAAAGL